MVAATEGWQDHGYLPALSLAVGERFRFDARWVEVAQVDHGPHVTKVLDTAGGRHAIDNRRELRVQRLHWAQMRFPL